MEIAIPLYDRFTALDAVGPYEVRPAPARRRAHLARRRARARCAPTPASSACIADARLRGPARPRHPDRARRHGHRRRARRRAPGRLDPARPRDLAVDDLGLHRLAAARAPRACSTGSRRPPTGSTSTRSSATGRGPTGRRVVEQGKVITAAGVSSGIDMAPAAGRAHRGAGGRAGDPARHRVRPAAPVRRRLHGQGAAPRSSSSCGASLRPRPADRRARRTQRSRSGP